MFMFRGSFYSKSLGQLAAFGCLLAVWCCASSAHATCGDYLSHAGDMASMHQRDPLAPAVPAAPCHGPNCHQAPDHPPLPAPQRVVIVSTRDILGLTVHPNELVLNAQWLAVPSDILCDSFSGLRLFRPPRSIA
jgi:hypothetical protein